MSDEYLLLALHDLEDWQPAVRIAAYLREHLGQELVDGRGVSRGLMRLLDEGAVERVEQAPGFAPPPFLWRITSAGEDRHREWMIATVGEGP